MPSDLFPDDLDFGQTIQIPRFGVGQKIFRRYILQKILGRGGMGIVWLAEDEDLETLVALKVLPETLCHDHASLQALKRETKLGRRLAHPNIVRIYDFQRDDNAAAISMEYVDGATFSEMRTTKPAHVFDPADLQTYIEALCDALHYAHNRERIVHRDLKPRNLMLNSQGDLKIADFGISRSISESIIMLTGKVGSSGSPPYISPQQWDGDPPTALDDIYSVGATLYELLSSKPPFIGVVDWRQVHHKVPPSISKRRTDLGIEDAAPIPAEWEETIAACLAKKPQDRPQTVRELQARLTINGQIPVATVETKAAPAISPGPEVAETVDSSEEDFFDEVTLEDLPDDTVHTATTGAEPKLDVPIAPVERPSAPASEPILKKLDDAIQGEVTPQHVSTARAEPKLDVPIAPVERPSAPASEPILKKLDDAIQGEVTPQHVSTARAEPKLDTPIAPVERPSAPASEPILKKLDDAIQGEVTPQHVSTARAEPKLDAPIAPVELPSAPASGPILDKPGGPVKEEVTPQHVSTARAEPKLDTPIAPVERPSAPASGPILDKPGGPVKEEVTPQRVSTARAEPKLDAPIAPVERPSAPASEPILDKLGGPVKDEVTPQHVSETLSKISEPAADAGAPATRRIAESAPPLGPLVSPVDSPDVFSPEKAAPANGDVAFPSTEVVRPDRPHVIRPRLGKVPRWVWVAAAVAAILILGGIFIPRKPPPPPSGPQVADLLIESEPSGANVTLDGRPPIKTPDTVKDLEFGRHRLTITLDGYSRIQRDIEFSGAKLPKMVLVPPPVEEIAKLSVRSDPPGATIRLDGTLPQEPNTFRNVKFGEHRLTATMEGFEPKEQLLVVSKDTSSEIILKLPPIRDPNQPLYDALKDAEAAYDWKTYQVVSLQLIDQLTSPGGPASNKNREKLTEVFEKLLTEGRKLNKERAARVSVKSLLLTSEEFRAHEKNLKSAARLDIVPAILIVADELRERKPTILGKVVQGDPEALNWYYYAAEKKNNTYAMTRIGWIYWWGECGQQVDKKQAFEWFKRASDAGDAEASTMVGESYLRGIGTPKDEDEGIRRLLPLTEKGWARAKNLIGQCYYNGVGQFGKLSQDERNRKAKSLYEGAILAGDWEACGHLGVMYEAGQGVPKDWRQAARLYLQGVEHENPICMYYYAQALENHGPELLKMLGREDDAETYYVKAAAAGVMEARQWCLEHKVKWSNSTPTPTPTATPLSP